MLYLEPLLQYTTDKKTSSNKSLYEEVLYFNRDTGIDGIFQYSSMEGFQVNYSNFSVANDLNVGFQVKEKQVEMHFSITGNLTSKDDLTGKAISVSQLKHNLFSLPLEYNTNLTLKADNQKIIKLDILLDQNYFENILDKENTLHQHMLEKLAQNKAFFTNIDYYNISPKMFSVLTEITANKRVGYFKKLFLEAKVIELFLLQTEVLNTSNLTTKNNIIKLSTDIDKLYYVKELIDCDPLKNYTLNELSKLACLNLFKLKNGFKEIFGTTVFGYINDVKMEIAKTMLLEKQMLVNQVAYSLGYNSPTNFSIAFKRKFNISPKQLKI